MATQGHHVPEITNASRTWDLTPPEIVRDGLRRLRSVGPTYRLALIVSAVLAALGLVGIIVGPLLSGYDINERQDWTYVAVAFAYLLSPVAAAPCLSAALRLARGHWRRPVNRISELWAIALPIPLVLFFIMLPLQPDSEGRPSLWFGWPASPWLWSSIMIVAMVLGGLAFLFVSAMPDFAIARDRLEQDRPGIFTKLARNWIGSERQWRVIERSVGLLGVLYIFLYVGWITIFCGDWIQSFIPGYRSAIFPLWFVETAFLSAVALVIVTAAVLRRWGSETYLDVEQFFGLAKLQLGLGLLWFYLTWTDFVILWYGRMPNEVALLKLLFFEPYLWLFIVAFALNFLGPLFVLMWTRFRRSITGPVIAAIGVLIGTLADRIRIMSAAFSPTDIYSHQIGDIPATHYPGIFDVVILIGAIAAAVALLLLVLRVVPYPSIWETTAGLRLRVRKRYKNTDVVIIGKPE